MNLNNYGSVLSFEEIFDLTLIWVKVIAGSQCSHIQLILQTDQDIDRNNKFLLFLVIFMSFCSKQVLSWNNWQGKAYAKVDKINQQRQRMWKRFTTTVWNNVAQFEQQLQSLDAIQFNSIVGAFFITITHWHLCATFVFKSKTRHDIPNQFKQNHVSSDRINVFPF